MGDSRDDRRVRRTVGRRRQAVHAATFRCTAGHCHDATSGVNWWILGGIALGVVLVGLVVVASRSSHGAEQRTLAGGRWGAARTAYWVHRPKSTL